MGCSLIKKKSGIMVFAPRKAKDIPCMKIVAKEVKKGKKNVIVKE